MFSYLITFNHPLLSNHVLSPFFPIMSCPLPSPHFSLNFPTFLPASFLFFSSSSFLYCSSLSYSALHNFDCLRANKSTSAWGVEARPPFLDADFMQLAMNIDPAEKMITKGEIILMRCRQTEICFFLFLYFL